MSLRIRLSLIIWQPGPEDVVDDAALAALDDEPEDVAEEDDGDGDE